MVFFILHERRLIRSPTASRHDTTINEKKKHGLEMCTFVLCEAPAALGPPGLHTTTREFQTCTLDGADAFKHHQNSTRRPPERDKKSENGGIRKQHAKFWAPHPSGPISSGSHFFLFGPHRGPTWVWAGHDTHQIQKWIGQGLAQLGLAKIGFGQNWFGQNHDGQSRS